MLAERPTFLPPQSAHVVDGVRRLVRLASALPQERLSLEHVFWAGLYARTLFIPEGVMITGARIVIPTLLIVSGDVLTLGDEGRVRITGYRVLAGRAGRKSVFIALKDTFLTMLFATDAATVVEAENLFTDEPETLKR